MIKKDVKICEDLAIKIVRHIVNGLRELINKKVINRDIKPENILIKDKIAKIADFGYSTEIAQNQQMIKCQFNVGSPSYMDPFSLK